MVGLILFPDILLYEGLWNISTITTMASLVLILLNFNPCRPLQILHFIENVVEETVLAY